MRERDVPEPTTTKRKNPMSQGPIVRASVRFCGKAEPDIGHTKRTYRRGPKGNIPPLVYVLGMLRRSQALVSWGRHRLVSHRHSSSWRALREGDDARHGIKSCRQVSSLKFRKLCWVYRNNQRKQKIT